jgi:hypothetical protein
VRGWQFNSAPVLVMLVDGQREDDRASQLRGELGGQRREPGADLLPDGAVVVGAVDAAQPGQVRADALAQGTVL